MAESRRRPAPGTTSRSPVRGARGSRSGLWHNPAMLNLIADICLLFGSTALAYASFSWFLRQPLFPLDEVVLLTPPAQVTEAQLEYAARSAVDGGFFTVDLDRVRETFEKLPWVRRAEVRRVVLQDVVGVHAGAVARHRKVRHAEYKNPASVVLHHVVVDIRADAVLDLDARDILLGAIVTNDDVT